MTIDVCGGGGEGATAAVQVYLRDVIRAFYSLDGGEEEGQFVRLLSRAA